MGTKATNKTEDFSESYSSASHPLKIYKYPAAYIITTDSAKKVIIMISSEVESLLTLVPREALELP